MKIEVTGGSLYRRACLLGVVVAGRWEGSWRRGDDGGA